MVRGSLQSELCQFFSVLQNDNELLTWGVWKSSYCEARKKFSADAFVELNQILTHEFYQQFHYRKWRGHRLLAVDASIVKLPAHTATYAAFGKINSKANDPSARISTLFDPLNNLTIDLKISPCCAGERSAAVLHLEHAQPSDIIIYDRGYPAAWLMALHQQKGIDFCFRASWSYSPETRAFKDTQEKEWIVTLKISELSKNKLDALNVAHQDITVRLIKIELPDSNESEVLITSLKDSSRYPYSEFAWLYHQRWQVEEGYKSLKSQLEIENFTGYSKLAIEQDIQAKSLAKNITALIVHASQKIIDKTNKQEKRQYRYKANFAAALRSMKGNMIRLFSVLNTKSLIIRLLNLAVKNKQPVRPDRKFERIERRVILKHSMRYKRC